GQSPWLDYIDRDLLESGTLARMVAEDGLRGVTSNPSIFAKAIGKGTEYDEAIRAVVAEHPDASDKEVYEHLAIRDIREACDIMRTVYDSTGRDDGFVSLEVAPDLADDTDGTVAEAQRLWSDVDRPNLMIKVPATPAGLPAIEQLIGEGINVNATLIFSVHQYAEVAHAYLRGLERLAAAHPERLAEVDSVASVFVSRVDSLVDKGLEAIGSREALDLRGNIAVANVKMVYQRYLDIFQGEAFTPWRRRGARVQRALWGSTSTKNPAYPDVLYVEELIGDQTVNTIPPSTMDAFRDHGRVADRLTKGLSFAAAHLAGLAKLGVDLHDVTETLQADGVKAFADAFDKLLATVHDKRERLAAG
ncbi:MAG: transaldolase, partial [Deltaproteobacteria bacterium]|nr:transaldolase [Deltaproteobacteria bacterium]